MDTTSSTAPAAPSPATPNPATRRRLRWAVPAGTAVVVAAAFAVPALANPTAGELPETTTADLLVAVAEAEPVAMSGTAVYTARLGLPEIPASLTGGADPLNLISGSSTIRVWTDGAERSRVSLLGATSEYSTVIDGPQVWTYASGKNEVVHVTLDPAATAMLEAAQAEHAAALPTADVPTPQDLAEQVLAQADPTTEVTLGENIVVAGRDAYQLVVTPRTDETLVAKLVVAIDGETHVPLSVQAWSTQDSAAPALELTFTDVSMTAPSDAALAFSVPAGASVEEKVIELADIMAGFSGSGAAPMVPSDPTGLPDGVAVTGSGWATVVERAGIDVAGLIAGDPAAVAEELADSPWAGRPAEDLAEEFRGDGTGFTLDTAALYEQLTTPVDGGRVLTSALLSVLVTDDGRVLVGAVPVQTLLTAAGLA